MADANALKQIIEKIKGSDNVLVTVNASPSVDELSAVLGITLVINKLNKHATAVFSGDVPPAIEFLNPEKTFENTVDSLRDFIIALDKEKADHLRYKVVDDMVKIFITPYRTTINQDDLDFSQGDYNVDAVLAIGVKTSDDLDHALESHGRILHDATVAAVSLGEPTHLGGIEWVDSSASSYSEMLFALADGLKSSKSLIDQQIATAFLTGIVAATDRFSNQHTTSRVMTIAAQLMSAGADQQLIASKLQVEDEVPSRVQASAAAAADVTLGKGGKVSHETSQGDAADGALLISHAPTGDVDEVAEEIASHNADSAVSRAEEELAKQTHDVASGRQVDATEVAEQKLAEQLAAATAGGGRELSTPTAVDIQTDIAQVSETNASMHDHEPELHNIEGKSRVEQEAVEPSLGGTLNATTEQAAEDARRQIEDDRNRTILSHSGSSYTTSVPAFQAPLNAVVAEGQSPEPVVRDVLAEGSDTALTSHVSAIQPPDPVSTMPTLAEIDAQNRSQESKARSAAEAALNGVDTNQSNTPQAAADGMPALPPLPPMPDFSTLPPLPPNANSNMATVPDQLGDVLPPASPPVIPQGGTSNDPAQFRIPGQ